MTQPEPPITLELDPSGFITGLGAAERQTEGFIGTLGQLNVAAVATASALAKVTPSRPMLAGFVGFSAAAANAEKQLSTLRATSKTTGANFDTLVKGSRQLARELPVGASGARQVVTAMTQLGVATKGNEKQVLGLAKAYTQLGGATSESPVALAQSMTQLSRATNSGQSVERITKLGDALTTVSAQSGSSALSVAQFSKAIAPAAQASGIGATKILGIASAFTKMGEDGFGAANAFSKMAGDLNRSIREGTPDLAKYANIVGTTASEFKALFEADPTEAITRVTESIARAGTSAPRLLESIGLEGTRNQRYIQQLVNTGGLRSGVNAAVAGYGSGATENAARAAFGGLADSTERLATNAQQAAEALGTPFLGPLTNLTDVFVALTGRLAGVLENSGVQKGLQGLGYAAVGLLAAFKVFPAVINALGLSRLATSGPVRGFGAGLIQANPTGVVGGLGRLLGGRGYLEAQAANGGAAPGSARMAPINDRFARAGAGLGGALTGTPGTGPGAFRLATGLAVQGAGVFLRTTSENVRNARLGVGALAGGGVGDRQDRMTARTAANERAAQEIRNAQRARSYGLITPQQQATQIAAAVRTLAAETGRAGPAIRLLSREIGVLAGQAVASSASLAGRAGGAVLGALGGPVGLALTGGLVAAQVQSSSNDKNAELLDASKNATNFLDDYAVAMGKATEATSTFAGALDAQAQAAIKSATSTTAALEVTEQDLRNASALGKDNRVRDYTQGSEAAVVRRLQGQLAGTGAGADEIERIQADLLNSGRTREAVGRISAQLPTEGNLDTDQAANIAGQVRDITSMPGRTGFRGFLGRLSEADRTRGESTRFSVDSLGEGQIERSRELVQAIQERSGRRAAVLRRPEEAIASALDEIDVAINTAIEEKNYSLAERLQKDFQADVITVSGRRRGRAISGDEIESAGSYSAALAAQDRTFREGDYARAQEGRRGRTGERAERYQGYASEAIGSDNPLGRLLDYRNQSDLAQRVSRLTGPEATPESPQAQSEAVRGAIQAARAAGDSFQQLASDSLEAANRLGEVGDGAQAFLTALRAAAQAQIRYDAPLRSSAETIGLQASQAADAARLQIGPNSTQATKAEQEAGVEGLAAVQEQVLARANARVAQERQIRLQRSRATEDFNRQQLYSEIDYNTQIQRAEEQFQISVARNEEQFYIGRARTIEDFNRQIAIAQRDFAKQMRRTSEDAARAMYDPFERIQVQSTWDPALLFGNLREQNEALAEQLRTLQDLRRRGLSEAAITLLQLNDPKNAQQARALTEATAGQIEGLNRASQARQQLGGKLANDPANLGMSRAREDFAQSIKDQNEQLQIGLRRGQDDFARSNRIMRADHARALRLAGEDRDRFVARSIEQQRIALDRMAEDVQMADQEIVQNLEQAQRNMNAVITGQALDLKNGVKSSLDGTSDLLRMWIDNDLGRLLREAGEKLAALSTFEAANSPGGSVYSSQVPRQASNSSSTNPGFAGTGGQGFGAVIGTGRVSSEYGQRGGRLHAGIDIAAPVGTPVKAYQAGEVVKVGAAGGYGLAIYLDHGGGRVTRYGHLSGFDVREGDQVRRGQQIGRSGNTGRSTGPHLHFETRLNGLPYNPRYAPFAVGGIVDRPTRALIGEAGSREAVIPLNRQGTQVLADAMRQFVSQEDGKMLRASSGVTYATYDYSSTTYDNRMIVEKVELKAESPRELAQQMEAKRRQSALTNGGRR